jgi:hypothetical protein
MHAPFPVAATPLFWGSAARFAPTKRSRGRPVQVPVAMPVLGLIAWAADIPNGYLLEEPKRFERFEPM